MSQEEMLGGGVAIGWRFLRGGVLDVNMRGAGGQERERGREGEGERGVMQ